ncbi:MAG: BRO-N domain-containing protein [Candidatus Nitrosoglobus sp.]
MNAKALTLHSTTFHPVVRNSQLWLTAVEIGTALGYSDDKSIHRIYARNAAEFTVSMTGVVKLTTPGGKQEVRIFSLRGAYLIGMFARTKLAAEFRRWVLDILDQYTAKLPQSAEETQTVGVPKMVSYFWGLLPR